MSYAIPADVETELGRPASSTAEADQWQAWLDRVERAIVRRFTRAGLVLADQVTANDPMQQDVIDVEVAAVIRKISNPLGLTSVTRTLDDGSITTRRDGVDESDGLTISAAEWEDLLPNSDSGAFSVRPGFTPDDPPALSWI